MKTDDIYCNVCKRETPHDSHGKFGSYSNDGLEYCGYRLYVCTVCKTGTMEEYYTNAEFCEQRTNGDWDEGDLDGGDYRYFPPRTDRDYIPKRLSRVPRKIRQIYEESINVLNAGFPVFSIMGIRAILDAVCKDQGIEGRVLGHKLPKLTDLVGLDIEEGLTVVKEWGNNAAHEFEVPGGWGNREIKMALDFCEHLLTELYQESLEEKSKKIALQKGNRNG